MYPRAAVADPTRCEHMTHVTCVTCGKTYDQRCEERRAMEGGNGNARRDLGLTPAG